ncbi:MAG: winged helix-turn-helix domain-containing protein [Candidatus Hodarchaeota archaeon]
MINEESEEETENILSSIEYSILGHIFISPVRSKIVISLLNGSVFPNQIQKQTNINFSSISKNLKKLEHHGIVKCQNPSQKIGRIYTLSKRVKDLEPYIRNWYNKHQPKL